MPFATTNYPVTFTQLDAKIIKDFIIGLGEGNGAVIPQIDDFSKAESTIVKVKYLLSGDAVLSSELDQAIEVDGSLKPDAFKGLVRSWIDQPSAKSKLQTFFELSLYQDEWEYPEDGTPLLGMILPQGGGNNQNINKTVWTQNLQESYARTVMKILDDDKPFNDIVSSSERMVTSALLSTLRFVDTANEGDGVELTDLTFNNHLRSLRASDFEDWRLVDLQSGGSGPVFSNMNAIRNIGDGGSIQLKITRPGFFNTLGFQFRFPTNDANDFRVLASETLVVATNRIFEAGDPTIEGDLSALDEDHAGPGTACYLCHRLLDPIRETFRTQYDQFYRFNPEGTVKKSEFAFQEHKGRSDDLPEFAQTLSQHPLFSVGWAGKLCEYINSEKCDEAHPEFIRITEAFKLSGLNFKTLLLEMLTSKLVSAKGGGVEVAAGGEEVPLVQKPLISIARQRHLCAAIDARYKQVLVKNNLEAQIADQKVCNWNANIQTAVSGVALTSTARGTAGFSQSPHSSAFSIQSLEETCKLLADEMVGGANDAFNGNNRTTSLAATTDMVNFIMGLASNHSRYQVSKEALDSLYLSAMNDVNLSSREALKQSFIFACSSPDMAGVGL